MDEGNTRSYTESNMREIAHLTVGVAFAHDVLL